MQSTTDTREQRGLALYHDYPSQIVEVSVGVYRVPSCSGGGYYRVDVEAQTCECPDFTHRAETCKHLVAATLADAKRRCRRTARRRYGERRDGISPNRRQHGRGSDIPERPSIAPDGHRDSLRGIVADPERLAELASRLGV